MKDRVLSVRDLQTQFRLRDVTVRAVDGLSYAIRILARMYVAFLEVMGGAAQLMCGRRLLRLKHFLHSFNVKPVILWNAWPGRAVGVHACPWVMAFRCVSSFGYLTML